jgi:hypothetical protein
MLTSEFGHLVPSNKFTAQLQEGLKSGDAEQQHSEAPFDAPSEAGSAAAPSVGSAGVEACGPVDGSDAALQTPAGDTLGGRAALGERMETQGVARDAIEQDLQMPSNMQVRLASRKPGPGGHGSHTVRGIVSRRARMAWP